MGIDFSGLNWFDIAVIFVVFLSTILAFFRGFIKGLTSLLTWVGSAVVAYLLYPSLSLHLENVINSETTRSIASIALIYIVSFIILSIINSKILYAFRRHVKGVVDRTLGFAFGFIRGVLIVCATYFSLNITFSMLNFGDNEERPGPEFFAEAKTYNILALTTKSLLTILPEDLPSLIVKRINTIKDDTEAFQSETFSASGGLPRNLNDEEKKMMAKVIKALPKDEYKSIREKYIGKVGGLTDLDKMEIFRDLLDSYEANLADGSISGSKVVPQSDIEALDEALNGVQMNKNDIPSDEGIGYKELNIKQLNRLVDSVKKVDSLDKVE